MRHFFKAWYAVGLILAAATALQAGEPLEIRIDSEGWGSSSVEDMQKVLQSAAQALWPQFEGRLDPIRVARSKSGPIVLFKRDSSGAYQVLLDTGDRRWAQLAFQFVHELCHILCRYRDGKRSNLWFEETLCEAASLYVLRRMAVEWEAHPPYPNWKNFAGALAKYAQERIDTHLLPENQTLGQWYRENEPLLRTTATDRLLNTRVAVQLLPLFEAEPAHWAAVRWLNEGGPQPGETLQDLFNRWRSAAPEKHRAFIDRLAGQFDLKGK